MELVSSWIWTRVAVSISYNNNHYTTGTKSKKLIIVVVVVVGDRSRGWPEGSLFIVIN